MSPTVCTLGSDADLVPPPRQVSSYYRLAPTTYKRAPPAKGWLLATRQDARGLFFPVSGAPYRRRGAMVVPSGIAQAVPGRSHLAIPGQIGPSRHHHCPAHFAAEPPRVRNTARTFLRSLRGESAKERRDRVGPSRTVFGQGWPNAEPTWMYSWRVLDGPTRSRCGLSGEKSPWHPAGSFAPFRGQSPLLQSQLLAKAKKAGGEPA